MGYHAILFGGNTQQWEEEMKNKEILFLDTETTGLDCDYHEIISVSVIRQSDGRLWTWKANPEWIDHIDDKAIAINGYKPQDWGTAITQNEMAHELGMILDGCLIVGHNPKFDLGFIENLFWRHGVKCRLSHHAIDTITLSYVYLVPWGLKSLSMDSIRTFLGWKRSKFHTCIQDAKDVERLFKLLTSWKRFILYSKLISKKLLGLFRWKK